jgi:hypothetical protein
MQGSLFPDPRLTATDDEVVEVLRAAIASSRGLSRMSDLILSGVCAEHLVERLHLAGLEIVRQAPMRLRE